MKFIVDDDVCVSVDVFYNWTAAQESAVTDSPQIQVSLILEFPVAKEMRLNLIIPKSYGIEIVGLAMGF